MLEITELQKAYGDFHLNVSMKVPAGQIVGLVGPNGAGKTTTIKSVLQLVQPDSGRIQVFGREYSLGKANFSREEKKKLGVVMPDSGFSGYMTVADICTACKAMYGELFERERFLKYCEKLELPQKKQIKTFSTGMKAKLKVIAALCHQADFLILDEPTAGLDVIARDNILDLLRDYMEEKENRGILISSHISSDLESLCDRLYMISKGEVIFEEDTDVLLSAYGLLKVTEAEYEVLDRQYILRKKKESFGYVCLTKEKQFYMENYPKLVVERAGIDDVVLLMEKGEMA